MLSPHRGLVALASWLVPACGLNTFGLDVNSSAGSTTASPSTGESTVSSSPTTTAGATTIETTAPTSTTATASAADTTSDETAAPVDCGDGVLDPGEDCDDDNLAAGDMCSRTCTSTVVVGISLGGAHSCVVFEAGTVRCWGTGAGGVLGNESTSGFGGKSDPLPAPDVAVGGEAAQIVAGQVHTCALLKAGSVRCWGLNLDGSLGYEDDQNRGDQPGEMPTADLVLGMDATRISAGARHTCVRAAGGAVRCWGGNSYGQLGSGSVYDVGASPGDMPPGDVVGVASVTELAAGNTHTCALLAGGAVKCWGSNTYGSLGFVAPGYVGDEPGEMPPPNTDVGGQVIRLSAGPGHTCAILQGGSVRCWGRNDAGQLGYGHTNDLGGAPGDMPPEALDLGGPAKQIATGAAFSCALLETGQVKCWGSGDRGQLGYGSTVSYGHAPGTMPPPAVELGGDATLLASSQGNGSLGFSCALLTDGTMRCWGINGVGNLGYGHSEDIGDDETPASAGPVPF